MVFVSPAKAIKHGLAHLVVIEEGVYKERACGRREELCADQRRRRLSLAERGDQNQPPMRAGARGAQSRRTRIWGRTAANDGTSITLPLRTPLFLTFLSRHKLSGHQYSVPRHDWRQRLWGLGSLGLWTSF